MRVTKEVMQKVIKWFAYGETGLSSKFMATYLTTGEGRPSYPHDPSDFNRCLLLLSEIPELKLNMHKLSNVNPQWSELVKHWDELERCFIQEVGVNWCNGNSAPITYKAMKGMKC